MRELRDCDFCGEGPAGAFELLPPDLDPTPAEQRRVVLCDDCKALLGDLMEPLLARAGADAGGAASSPDAQEDGGRRAHSAGAGRPSDDAGRGSEEEATESPDPLGGTTIDPGDGPAAEEASTADDSTTADNATAADDPADPDEDDGPGPTPPAYGKVLRLLRNRELPMARSDVEALAAGAYELEGHEVEAVIDHALDRDELVESGDQLRLP